LGGEAQSLSKLWAVWEQEGRALWQEMDDLVVILHGMLEQGDAR
jgi:hypothetical protein